MTEIPHHEPVLHGHLLASVPNGYILESFANPDRDPWTIRLTGQVGRVSFHVPLAGYVLFYAHTRELRGSLIAIAALLVLAGLLRHIWRTETPAPSGSVAR